MRKIIVPVILFFSLTAFFGFGKSKEPLKNTQITQEQFDELKNTNEPLFIGFNATWCGQCRKQDAALFEIKDNYQNKAKIFWMNWDKRKEYNISYPKQRTTIVFYKKGQIIDQLIGENNKDKIQEFLDKNIYK
ncbi:thioredoxin family protein [Rickettsiales bacterium]|nr:thioredoxin family protein [Rickettsiales bacterium]